VTVCNIDNGFGAAFAAFRILQAGAPARPAYVDISSHPAGHTDRDAAGLVNSQRTVDAPT
jgi:hypothetical protein